MKDYLDASALIAVLLSEDGSEAVEALIFGPMKPVLVSDFCLAECSAAIAGFERIGRLHTGRVETLFENLDIWDAEFGERTEIASSDITAATAMVRRLDLKLRTPDAIHIAVARRLDARLVTLDHRMAEAAAQLNLDCINPAVPAT